MLAMVAVLVVVTWGWARRERWLRWWRLRRAPLRLRHPIVLVHGLLGFDDVRLGTQRHEYFRGVEERLRRHGNTVYRPRLPPVASVERRAQALDAFLRSLGPRQVVVIAHSMGGLDARFALARLGADERVRALVTIGTPHRGTPVADTSLGVVSKVGLRPLAARLGVDIAAFEDLTCERMERFNEEVPDVRGVLYASVVSAAADSVHPLLQPTRNFLARRGEPSDGIVPRDSQRWGVVLQEIEADHWEQIGWGERADAGTLFEGIVRELRARGL